MDDPVAEGPGVDPERQRVVEVQLLGREHRLMAERAALADRERQQGGSPLLVLPAPQPLPVVVLPRACRGQQAPPIGGQAAGGADHEPHYGPVTTTSVISPPTPGPEPGCLTLKGTSTVTLVKNRRSTLRFAFQSSTCGPHNAWGTFRIVSGTGTFTNAIQIVTAAHIHDLSATHAL